MSTKSKARAARRHPSEETTQNEPTGPRSLHGEEKQAAGEIMGAVLNLVTLGAVEPERASQR